MKSRILRLASRFIGPGKHTIGSVILNRLGLQVVRTLIPEGLHRLRPRKTDSTIAHYLPTIERDGLVVINNFLSEKDFAELREHLQSILEKGGMKFIVDRDGSGVNWSFGPIMKDTEEGKVIIEKVAENPALLALVRAVTRRRITRPPPLIYQKLEVPEGSIHEDDHDSVIHADRHFSSIKAYFTLNPNFAVNGAFVWCPGSHKISWSRLRHEYEYSVNQARFQKKGASAVDPDVLEGNRVRPSSHAIQAMRLKEVSIETEGNTLVVSNNRGFHRRGTIQPGQYREQLRMIFYYLEEPSYVTLMWPVLRWLSRRRLVPSSVSEALTRRGLQ